MRLSRRFGITAGVLMMVATSVFAQVPGAQGGALDLSGWNWADGSVTLRGEWAFLPNRIVSPEQFQTISDGEMEAESVPAAWTLVEGGGGRAFGVGTYRLLIDLPPGSEQLAVRASRIRTAARIYANGQLVHEAGTVGTDRTESKPVWSTDLIELPGVTRGRLDLVVQVSNFHDRGGGLQEALTLGSEEKIRSEWLRRIIWDLLAFGILGAAGVYHVIIYSMRRHDPTPLVFGGAAIFLGLRVLVVGQTLITTMFPGLPFGIHLDLVHITGSIPLVLMILFMERLFPDERWRIVGLVMVAINTAYTVFVLALPTWIYVSILPYYQIAMLGSGVYIALIVVRAIIHKRRASIPFGLTFFVLFIAFLNDILSDRFLVGTPFLAQYAMLLVVVAQGLLLARIFVVALKNVQQQAEMLQLANTAMERFVPREFLRYLNRENVTEVQLGDHVSVEMSVMFVDIRSFTQRTDSMQPGETFEFINDYLAAVGPVIRRSGGFVDKYMGDGIMAIFPDSSETAVRAGVGIVKMLARLNQRITEQGQAELRIGIGIHTGHLMLGTIGESQRIDSTVISPVVNVAKRIEEQTKELGISFAASRTVLERISDRTWIKLKNRGAIELRGVSEPVEVFQVEPA